MTEMIRILFVCHGNICRSPMAEMIMKSMVEEKGLSDRFEIASCATSSEELDNPIYPPARKVLEKHGIHCEKRHARRMTLDDYSEYDMIIAMDRQNIRNMKGRVGDDPERKVRLLMEFAGNGSDVADPWYTGDFDATYRDISVGCSSLLDEIIRKHSL